MHFLTSWKWVLGINLRCIILEESLVQKKAKQLRIDEKAREALKTGGEERGPSTRKNLCKL